MDNNEEPKTKEYIKYLLETKVFLISALYIDGYDAEFTFMTFDEDATETKRTYYVNEDDVFLFVNHLYVVALLGEIEDDMDIDDVEKDLAGKQIPIRLLDVEPDFYIDHEEEILLTIKIDKLIKTKLASILAKEKLYILSADIITNDNVSTVSFIFKNNYNDELTQINIVDEEDNIPMFVYYLYKFALIEPPETFQLDDVVAALKGKEIPKNVIYTEEKTKKLILRERLL